jgi:hypothetical protein
MITENKDEVVDVDLTETPTAATEGSEGGNSEGEAPEPKASKSKKKGKNEAEDEALENPIAKSAMNKADIYIDKFSPKVKKAAKNCLKNLQELDVLDKSLEAEQEDVKWAELFNSQVKKIKAFSK